MSKARYNVGDYICCHCGHPAMWHEPCQCEEEWQDGHPHHREQYLCIVDNEEYALLKWEGNGWETGAQVRWWRTLPLLPEEGE